LFVVIDIENKNTSILGATNPVGFFGQPYTSRRSEISLDFIGQADANIAIRFFIEGKLLAIMNNKITLRCTT